MKDLIDCFVKAYYLNKNKNNRHKLFAKLLSDKFDLYITEDEARKTAEDIAMKGVVIHHEDGKVKAIG